MAEQFGAGPFFVRQHIALLDVVIRGRPGTFDHSSAYGQWGHVMVELVEDHGDGPSPVREMYNGTAPACTTWRISWTTSRQRSRI